MVALRSARTASVALVLALSACGGGGGGGGSSGPAGDFTENFVGTWRGSATRVEDGQVVDQFAAEVAITALAKNRLSLSQVCPDGAPASASIGGPGSFSVDATTCSPVPVGFCPSVVTRYTRGSGTLQGGRLSIGVEGTMTGCNIVVPLQITFSGTLPPEAVYAISPPSIAAGEPGFVLSLLGYRFSPSAVVTWNGSPRPTTRVSSTALLATISAADVAAEGSALVAVVDGAGTFPAPQPFSILRRVPVVSGLTPPGAVRGGPDLEVTVAGALFQPGAVVLWNGFPRATTYVSPAELRAVFLASDLAEISAAGTWSVTVALPGGATSEPVQFAVDNPAPTLAAIDPPFAVVGGAGLTLAATGTGFFPDTVLLWNGSPRPTTWRSFTSLTADLAAEDLAAVRTAAVAVQNGAPGGGTSAALPFAVAEPAPAISALGPPAAVAGAPRFTLTVVGSGFLPGSELRWDGAPRPTVVVSRTVLHASISAADVASPGAVALAVHAPAPALGDSAPVAYTIEAPAAAPRQARAWQLDPGHTGSWRTPGAATLASSPAWSRALGGRVAYPLVAGGKVFTLTEGAADGAPGSFLQALDLASGASDWGPITVSGAGVAMAGQALDGGRLFTLRSDGLLAAFDGATGAAAWTLALDPALLWDAPPTADGGLVFVAGGGNPARAFAVDGATGALRWSTPLAPGSGSSPSLSPDGVFLHYTCSSIKLDRLTGSFIWNGYQGCSSDRGATTAYAAGRIFEANVEIPAIGGWVRDAFDVLDFAGFGRIAPWSIQPLPLVAVDPAGLYVVADGGILGMSPLGDLQAWTFAGDGQLLHPPLVLGDLVVAASTSGAVFAVDASSGQQRWAGAALSSPDPFTIAPLPPYGLGAGEGFLLVPAGGRLTAWQVAVP